MRRVALLNLMTVVALAACSRSVAPEAQAPRPAGLAVDAAWLAENVGAADVMVLQVAPDAAVAPQLAGARFLPLHAVAVERDGNANELPPVDELRATFEQLGVGDSTRVVLVGEPLHAARAFLALDVLGHTRVSLLDGGYAAWNAAGSPALNASVSGAAARITSAPRTERIVDAPYVRERLDADQVLLVDARPSDQAAAQRIPGAASLFWQETLLSPADPRLLPPAELHALFDNAGGDTATELVIYCRSGMQASFLYFVARSLGYDVRMYDGSLADWTARGLPLEP